MQSDSGKFRDAGLIKLMGGNGCNGLDASVEPKKPKRSRGSHSDAREALNTQ